MLDVWCPAHAKKRVISQMKTFLFYFVDYLINLSNQSVKSIYKVHCTLR